MRSVVTTCKIEPIPNNAGGQQTTNKAFDSLPTGVRLGVRRYLMCTHIPLILLKRDWIISLTSCCCTLPLNFVALIKIASGSAVRERLREPVCCVCLDCSHVLRWEHHSDSFLVSSQPMMFEYTHKRDDERPQTMKCLVVSDSLFTKVRDLWMGRFR